MKMLNALTGAVALVAVAGAALPASAQTPEEFYAGKTVELYIGYSVGGGYDTYARLVARHIGKHIPGNPTVVPVNMEGAGSLRATNWLYNAAPKDGTVFGTFARGAAFEPLLGQGEAQYDATEFNWIGSANDEVSICAAWKTAEIASFEELREKELIVGGTGRAADTDTFPRVINGVFGTKMETISGYPGGNDITLAMERGEVQGRCGWSWSSVKSLHSDWVENGDINILVQLSLNKHPDLPNVPLIMDFVENDEQRQILELVFARQVMGRPFAAPPGVPEDRVEALREAFMATMEDPEFLAEAETAELEITAVSGADIQELVERTYEAPSAVVEQTKALME
jgi:tripartite-type tricarboxylate transporter receptor subunit TctC